MPVVRLSAAIREPSSSSEQISNGSSGNCGGDSAQSGEANALKLLGLLRRALFAQTENREGKGDKFDRNSHDPDGAALRTRCQTRGFIGKFRAKKGQTLSDLRGCGGGAATHLDAGMPR